MIQTDDEADTSGNRDSGTFEDQRPPNMETNYPVSDSSSESSQEEGPGQEYTAMVGATSIDVPPNSAFATASQNGGRTLHVSQSRDRMGGTICEAEHGQFESEF